MCADDCTQYILKSDIYIYIYAQVLVYIYLLTYNQMGTDINSRVHRLSRHTSRQKLGVLNGPWSGSMQQVELVGYFIPESGEFFQVETEMLLFGIHDFQSSWPQRSHLLPVPSWFRSKKCALTWQIWSWVSTKLEGAACGVEVFHSQLAFSMFVWIWMDFKHVLGRKWIM